LGQDLSWPTVLEVHSSVAFKYCVAPKSPYLTFLFVSNRFKPVLFGFGWWMFHDQAAYQVGA